MTDIKEKARIVIVREKVKNIRGRPASRLIKATARYRIIEKAKRQNSSESPVDKAELFAAEMTQTAVGLGAGQIQSMRRRGSAAADNTPQEKMHNLLIIHCTGGGYNNVVITGMDGFFGITARPQWY